MSNELLNAYIRFGEPDGDDLDFSQIADWAGYLLQEQRERIAELDAEISRCLALHLKLNDELQRFREALERISLGYVEGAPLTKQRAILKQIADEALEKET